MPVETRTLPGRIAREPDGEPIVSGWCLIVYRTGVRGEPLDAWWGEMACSEAGARTAIANAVDATLYLHLDPYGGEFEPWHGPVIASLIDPELDPDERRITLKSAGPLIRSYRSHAEASSART